MNHVLTFYTFMLISCSNLPAFAQNVVFQQQSDTSELDCSMVLKSINADPGNIIIDYLESFPEIIGGEKQIERLLVYQDIEEQQKYTGKVFLGLWVDSYGEKQCMQVVKGDHEQSNNEALRILSQLKFKPGRQNGKPVSVIYYLIIDFDKASVKKKKRK